MKLVQTQATTVIFSLKTLTKHIWQQRQRLLPSTCNCFQVFDNIHLHGKRYITLHQNSSLFPTISSHLVSINMKVLNSRKMSGVVSQKTLIYITKFTLKLIYCRHKTRKFVTTSQCSIGLYCILYTTSYKRLL